MSPNKVLITVCSITGVVIFATPTYLVAEFPGDRVERKHFSHIDDLFALPLKGVLTLVTEYLCEIRQESGSLRLDS